MKVYRPCDFERCRNCVYRAAVGQSGQPVPAWCKYVRDMYQDDMCGGTGACQWCKPRDGEAA